MQVWVSGYLNKLVQSSASQHTKSRNAYVFLRFGIQNGNGPLKHYVSQLDKKKLNLTKIIGISR